jgi:hypothetical protein
MWISGLQQVPPSAPYMFRTTFSQELKFRTVFQELEHVGVKDAEVKIV